MSVRCSVIAEGVGLVMIDRPEVHNCIDTETEDALRAAWAWVEATNDIRSAILTGAGERAFCTGAEIGSYLPELKRRARTNTDDGNFGGLTRSYPTGKPIIAAINGLALGGGLELALACDLRLASANASFGLPEVRWGVIAGGGGVTRLPRLISPALAAETLLTGGSFDASTALREGLVSAVFQDHDSLMKGALERAAAIAANAPLAVRETTELVRRSRSIAFADALEMERQAFRRVITSRDAELGIEAFTRRQAPKFQGT